MPPPDKSKTLKIWELQLASSGPVDAAPALTLDSWLET